MRKTNDELIKTNEFLIEKFQEFKKEINKRTENIVRGVIAPEDLNVTLNEFDEAIKSLDRSIQRLSNFNVQLERGGH